MAQLPQEISRLVNDMQPGDISQPFIMTDPKTNREKVAFVKLTSRIPGHRANISDDYQLVKDMYENSRREEVLNTWLSKKIKNTYIRIEDGWKNCDFKHDWNKQQ